MYYITKKDSETGKKFQELLDTMRQYRQHAFKIAERFGTTKIVRPGFSIDGGVFAVVEPTIIDDKLIRPLKKFKVKNSYVPNTRTKKGKELQKELDELPVVMTHDLNAVIGWDEAFSNIGYDYNNPEYFAFSVKESWNIKMPEDCTEITTAQYKEMFNPKLVNHANRTM